VRTTPAEEVVTPPTVVDPRSPAALVPPCTTVNVPSVRLLSDVAPEYELYLAIGLQLLDPAVELLAERHAEELIQQRLVEALADPIGLRASSLGERVIDGLDVKLGPK
jgi:hypothetical protein